MLFSPIFPTSSSSASSSTFPTLQSSLGLKSNFSLNSDLASCAKPHIIIVGGGIGGLMLAILLEHGQMPYTVLERSSDARLVGSAIALGPGVLPLFNQLGMLREIEKYSKPVTRGMVWSEKMVPIMDLDHTTAQKRYGYLTRIIARPKLYHILLSRVPTEKIHMGKKVVSYTQEPLSAFSPSLSTQSHQQRQQRVPESKSIVVDCEDGSQYWGDVLVGADGAYSVTRQLMYQHKEDDYVAFITAAKIASISLTEDHNKDEPSNSDPDLDSDLDSDLISSDSEISTTPSSTTTATITSSSQQYSTCYTPLPNSDKEPLVFTSTCLVGQTRPGLDLKKFKYIRGPECKIGSVVGDNKPYSWSIFSMPDDSVCWMVTQHLGESFHVTSPTESSSGSSYHSDSSSVSSRCSTPPRLVKTENDRNDNGNSSSNGNILEWGPGKVEIMCNQIKDFPIPCGPGLKVSDLLQETDQEKISKVMLEEKLFETWSYGRVVLIGDACHKMHPSAGLGAVAAIQDAAVLSDIIYHLPPSASSQDLALAFETYHKDRYRMVKQSYETSYQMSHLNEQSWIGNFIRKVMSNLPKWIWYRVLDSMYEYRPQVSFLPKIEDGGDVPPLPDSYLAFNDTVDMTDVD
ncbi:hypothetical protein BGZ46_001130 [Entomortierella lignicola]|nr:hypothetical protein BGZ46_001130 [Entomortierella lignicola]